MVRFSWYTLSRLVYVASFSCLLPQNWVRSSKHYTFQFCNYYIYIFHRKVMKNFQISIKFTNFHHLVILTWRTAITVVLFRNIWLCFLHQCNLDFFYAQLIHNKDKRLTIIKKKSVFVSSVMEVTEFRHWGWKMSGRYCFSSDDSINNVNFSRKA